jgi:hypothetical protein
VVVDDDSGMLSHPQADPGAIPTDTSNAATPSLLADTCLELKERVSRLESRSNECISAVIYSVGKNGERASCVEDKVDVFHIGSQSSLNDVTCSSNDVTCFLNEDKCSPYMYVRINVERAMCAEDEVTQNGIDVSVRNNVKHHMGQLFSKLSLMTQGRI